MVYAFNAYSPVGLQELLSPSGGSPLSDSACIRIVTVKGSSMEPKFKDGQVTTFNKCLQGKNAKLTPGAIVLIEKTFQPEEITVIRKKTGIGSTATFTVSPMKSPDSTKEVKLADIKAIYELN